MSYSKILFLILVLFSFQIYAQLSAPVVESVYGGRILENK